MERTLEIMVQDIKNKTIYKMQNQLIIFSKNRACQLNLLLDSINLNANQLFDKISVLYKAEDQYIDGYDLLKTRTSIDFIEEMNFRNDLIRIIDDDIMFTTFLVDDAIFFDKITEPQKTLLNWHDNVICLSLRLGLNCVYSHPANLQYKINNYGPVGIDDNFIMFVHTEQDGDFSYPLSTDGHIYMTSVIKDLLVSVDFNNPNTLEANLQRFKNVIPKLMISFKHSKLVSVPVNLVNTTFNNRNGLIFPISNKELNDRFLNNEIIDLHSLNFLDINGPHKEIEYKFKK